MILALETTFQFMIWDILGGIIFWTGKALTYIFVLTPLLLIGMLGESLRRLKNKVRFNEFYKLY
jgi:hypothetical protein